MSLAGSFAKFGVTLKNPRQSWSGRSSDGETVVVTLWRPECRGKPFRYEGFADNLAEARWIDTFGNRERLENLIWAEDHCNGLFRAVIVVPKDESARTWEIADSWPIDPVMRITKLNRETGEFSAEPV